MPKTKKTKPATQLRENVIRVTATDEQKKIITKAAAKAGNSVSSWLLSLGLVAARKMEGEVT